MRGRALTVLNCVAGCTGYDNCWIYDHSEEAKPGVSLWSDLSGIRFVPSRSIHPLCISDDAAHVRAC